MINVVVSRYNKDTSFVEKLKKYNTCCMIYDKKNPENIYNIPVNRGNEASVYLKYIIDHYDKLTDYTFFIHDEEYSWHHEGSIEERFVEAINSNEYYFNINNLIWREMFKEKDEVMEWYDKYIEPYIPFEKLPNKDWIIGYKGCAQFLVHKSRITNLPLKFYQDLYDWVLNHTCRMKSGYFLEWTWHLFWEIFPTIR